MKNGQFFGVDANIKTSIFEYNFLLQWNEKENEFFCWYRCPYEFNKFATSWINEKEINDLILGNDWLTGDDLSSFLDSCDIQQKDVESMPIQSKVSSLLSYFGALEIFGDSYHNFSEKELCEEIGIEYQKN